MSYRTLLVLVDSGPLCHARTEVAIRLAMALHCHLIGLAPTGLVHLPVWAEAAGTLAEFAAISRQALRDEASRAANRFTAQCAAAGLASHEVVIDEAQTASSLVRHAHASDLTVMSQPNPLAVDHAEARDAIEAVVLQSARPTLIVPYAGHFESIGTDVLVAWDGSPEATHAVNEALPLLRRARRVRVVSWAEAGSRAADALRPRQAAMQRWLARQGTTAEVSLEVAAVNVADAMLSLAADSGCDLIVMGAYGHPRWAERMLGGATGRLLHSMTLPVLMAH
ncbi:MAG: universal stress protein [Rhizobacter sp.]